MIYVYIAQITNAFVIVLGVHGASKATRRQRTTVPGRLADQV